MSSADGVNIITPTTDVINSFTGIILTAITIPPPTNVMLTAKLRHLTIHVKLYKVLFYTDSEITNSYCYPGISFQTLVPFLRKRKSGESRIRIQAGRRLVRADRLIMGLCKDVTRMTLLQWRLPRDMHIARRRRAENLTGSVPAGPPTAFCRMLVGLLHAGQSTRRSRDRYPGNSGQHHGHSGCVSCRYHPSVPL